MNPIVIHPNKDELYAVFAPIGEPSDWHGQSMSEKIVCRNQSMTICRNGEGEMYSLIWDNFEHEIGGSLFAHRFALDMGHPNGTHLWG